jgi:hypothetical protein
LADRCVSHFLQGISMPARITLHRLTLGLTLLTIASFTPVAHAADAVTTTDQPAAEDSADKADEAVPLISIEGDAELQMDAGLGKHRTTAIFATIEPEITVNLSDTFRLFGHFVFEPVEDPIEARTNVFHSQGLYAQELYAGLTVGQVKFALGKINPVFGVATDEAPGIYGTDLASNYDVKGALGLGASVFLTDNTIGSGDEAITVKQVVDVSLFTADPSVLSRSLLTDRGQFSWRDTRVGNTDLPESFALAYVYSTMNADDEVAGPTGRVAMRRLASRGSNVPDEWDILAAGQTAIDLGDERTLRPIAELAYFIHEGGYKRNAGAATLGLEFQQGDWITSAVAAGHERFGAPGPSDYILTASVGRIFKTETTGEFRVDAAYSNVRSEGVTSNVIGLRLHKDISWESSSSGL